ncbi:alpha/beta fold hydrolase [Falsibacillus albus]|nr:alpha/beta hydrolase [Falsibacillus albus]
MQPFMLKGDGHEYHGYCGGDSNKPLMVLHHGMTADALAYSSLLEELKEQFHFILLDSPGHGRTPPYLNEEKYHFTELSKNIFRIIAKLSKSTFILVGHSWGGDLCLHIAKNFQERVLGVVLLDGGYVFPDYASLTKHQSLNAWKEYLKNNIYDNWNEVISVYQDYTTKKWDEALNATIASSFKYQQGKFMLISEEFTLLSIIKAFYFELCSSVHRFVQCPVLLIHATIPFIDTSREDAIENIKKSITNLSVLSISNTKHNPNWNHPELVAEEIFKWIRTVVFTDAND